MIDRTARAFAREGDSLVARGTASPFTFAVSADGMATMRPSPRSETSSSFRTVAPLRGSPSITTPDTIVIDRGVMEERLHNSGASVEQSWRFPSPPASPPVVRVATSGMSFAGATSTGLHFADPATSLGVRYGRATWIDAHGKRTPVPATFEGSEIVLRVGAEAADGPYPAVLDPTLTAEQGIDQPTSEPVGVVGHLSLVPGPAQTFLATWVEGGGAGKRRLRAVRVGTNGMPIGAPVMVVDDVAASPSVAWDGTRWLVVAAGPANTRLVRVAADGTLVDAVPKTIAGKSTAVAAAYDGSKFFVAYEDSEGSTAGTLRSIRVDPATGAPDATTTLVIAGPAATAANTPTIHAACGTASTGCAVAWLSAARLRVSRVSNANALLDANGIDTGALQIPSGLACDGNQWLVAWDAGTPLKAARIAADGTLTAAPDFTSGSNLSFRYLGFDGTDFVALWSSGFNSYYIFARRMSSAGTLVDASPVIIDQSGGSPGEAAIASSGAARVLLFIRSTTFGLEPLYTRPYSAAFAATGPAVAITKGSNTQRDPHAGFNGSTFLVLWNDNRATPGPGIYAARLDANGAPIDAVGTKVDFNGDVASDGDGFLVVRAGLDRVEAKRFSKTSATPIDAAPIVVAPSNVHGYSPPRVAFDGANYVVVWNSSKTEPLTGPDIRAARVTPSGTVLDPEGFAVTTATGPQTDPGIASDGKGSFVVWVDRRTDYYEGDIHAARVTQAGVVLDPQSILIARRAREQWSPRAAPAGDGWTVIWGDDINDASEPFATHVSAAGIVDPKPFALGTAATYESPQIVGMNDGVTQLAAWTSQYGAAVAGGFVRSSPSVEPLDAQPIDLSTPPGPVGTFSLVPAGAGRAAVLYSRFVEGDATARVRLRFVSSGAGGGTTCAAANDCQTRWCRESVCCTEKCDGACRKCAATTGACEIVRLADDPDTCTGENTCDAEGACKKRNGSVCEQASECASGHCIGSFCCDTPCDGACESCTETRGTCTPRARGSLGTPSCSPHRCDGTSRSCATTCLVDSDCADGNGCDRPTGTCISGAVCTDIGTLRDNGNETQCAPYACRGGKCFQSCMGVTDCAFPAVCEETGRCVSAPAASAGACAMRTGTASGESGPWMLLGAAGIAFGIRARRRR